MKITIEVPDDYYDDCLEHKDICKDYALKKIIELLEAIRVNHKKTRPKV